MIIDSFSGKGKRENNEDYILSRQISPDCSIFILADGMGGYSYGEVASSLVCETIAECFDAHYGKSDVKTILLLASATANKKINDIRKELSSKLGTTIAGVIVEKSTAFLFWLGDVRVYYFRNKELLFRTEDHSLINEMRKQGNLSVKDIERYKVVVTRSISGNSIKYDPSFKELSLNPNDVLVMCSDGFWQNVQVPDVIDLSEAELQSFLSQYENSMDDNYSLIRIII